jgi:hypothetical protein
MRIMRINFQEFINKRAIVDHGLPHFFRAGFPPLPSQRERASGTVILNNHWMVDGQVGRTPIEVFKRVATCSHHLRDELIGFADGALRVVHEARLDATPFAGKRADLFLSELVQVEAADALGAFSQNGVRTFGTHSLNGSFVLGTKTFTQVDPLSPARVRPGCKREQQHNNTNPDNQEGL